MTEYVDLGVSNNKWKMFVSGYIFDKSNYNELEVAALYYFEPPTHPNNDLLGFHSRLILSVIAYGDV